MSKHTPGPWVHALEYGPNITELPRITTVARCANYVIGLPSDYPGGNYRDGDPSGDEEADARLISQAPAMLEALEEMLEVHGVRWEHVRGDSSIPASWAELSDKARAVIRAAKGE